MTKRIEIVLTPHGPELKPSHSFQIQPKQRGAGMNLQVSPVKPIAIQTVKSPSSPKFVLKDLPPSEVVPIPRKPAPPDSPISSFSPAREGRQAPGCCTSRAVGSLLGEIHAATSSALRSVQSFHSKKTWDLYASSEWSSSPVGNRTAAKEEISEPFREDYGRMTLPSDPRTQRAPKKRDLNSFVRNSLMFCPKAGSQSSIVEGSESPQKRCNWHSAITRTESRGLSQSQSSHRLVFGEATSPMRKEARRGGEETKGKERLHPFERSSDVPAPAPEAKSMHRSNQRHTPSAPEPISHQVTFKAKLLAKALHRAKS